MVAALAAAAVEEMVFRGVVQVSLQRAAGRAGLIGASVLFAATYLELSTATLIMVLALGTTVAILRRIRARDGGQTGNCALR